MDDISMSLIGKALSHPIRVGYLRTLTDRGRLSPSEYARDFDLPLANVSYHAKALLQIEVLKVDELIQRRGSMEHRHSLTEDNGRNVVATIDFLDSSGERLETTVTDQRNGDEDASLATKGPEGTTAAVETHSDDVLLGAIRSSPGVSSERLAVDLGLRPTQVSVLVAKARSKGLIRRLHDGWEVSEDV